MLREESKGFAVERGPAVCVPNLNGGEMSHERRCDDARNGRQRAKIVPSVSVAIHHAVDGPHTPHRIRPLAADGEDLTEIGQVEHGEDGLECVSVEAHRRGDRRGGLSGGKFRRVSLLT